ncbi:MAG: hypothetical protein ACE5LU_26755 [Anaerolineae bacterium]
MQRFARYLRATWIPAVLTVAMLLTWTGCAGTGTATPTPTTTDTIEPTATTEGDDDTGMTGPTPTTEVMIEEPIEPAEWDDSQHVYVAYRWGEQTPDEVLDVVFVPEADYGDIAGNTPAEFDRRQAFLDDVYGLIDTGFWQNQGVLQNWKLYNFSYMTTNGTITPPSSGVCPTVEWPDLTQARFADMIVMVHLDEDIRDCARRGRVSSKGLPGEEWVVVHEAQHALFHLPDEYCCDGGYYDRPPILYPLEDTCHNDPVPVNGAWSDCQEVANAAQSTGWWRSENHTQDVMSAHGPSVDSNDPVLEYGPADWAVVRQALKRLKPVRYGEVEIVDPSVKAPDNFTRDTPLPASMPTPMPATVLTPVPTPPDIRWIALLRLLVQSIGEFVQHVELESLEIVDSFAPNVFGLPGPWRVALTIPPPSGVAFGYAVNSGSLDLEINGELWSEFDNFADIHGATIGGVDVIVTDYGDEQGSVELVGTIESLVVGGDNLVIDHMCRLDSEMCIDFEDQFPGARFEVGDAFVDQGFTVTVQEYSSVQSEDGFALVETGASGVLVDGSGQFLWLNGVDLAFDLDTISYGVMDPRRVETYDSIGDEDNNYIDEDVLWELVVPLSDDEGKDLQVERIDIYDQDGEIILSTDVEER